MNRVLSCLLWGTLLLLLARRGEQYTGTIHASRARIARRALSCLLCAALLLLLARQIYIGRIYDSMTRVVIGDTEYTSHYGPADDPHVTFADRGRYLGKVSNGKDVVFTAYSVKGDREGKYLYCFWQWEGLVYVRADTLQAPSGHTAAEVLP